MFVSILRRSSINFPIYNNFGRHNTEFRYLRYSSFTHSSSNTEKTIPDIATTESKNFIKKEEEGKEFEIERLRQKCNELEEKLSKFENPSGIRGYISKYGIPFALWYFFLYTAGLAGCVFLFHNDYIEYEQVRNKFHDYGLGSYVDRIPEQTGKITSAVVTNELLEIVRVPFAIVTIAPILKRMRRI